jgi:WD40 repeat protein
LSSGGSTLLEVTNAWVYQTWSVAFSADGKKLYTGSSDKVVRVWDLATAMPTVLSSHTDHVTFVTVSPAGDRLLTLSYDNTAKLWDAGSGQVIQTIDGLNFGFPCGAFSPSGGEVALARRDGALILLSTETGEVVRNLNSTEGMHSLRFSPDGTEIFGAGSRVQVFSASAPDPVAVYLGHSLDMLAAKFSGDSPAKVYGFSWDGQFMSWDLATGTLLQAIQLEPPYETDSAAFARSGQRLLTRTEVASGTGYASEFKIHDLDTLANPLTIAGNESAPGSTECISEDGTLVAIGTSEFPPGGGDFSHTIELRHAHDGTPKATLTGGEGDLAALLFSDDNRFLASLSSEPEVTLWDVESGARLRSFAVERNPIPLYSCVFSPDGKNLLVGGDQDPAARLYDVRFGTLQRTFESERMPSAGITAVAIAPNGALTALGRWDGRIFLFETETARLVADSGVEAAPIRCVEFSPDSSAFLTADDAGAVKIWSVEDASFKVRISQSQGMIEIRWPSGILEWTSDLNGSWTSGAGLTSPLRLQVWETESLQFFRLRTEVTGGGE